MTWNRRTFVACGAAALMSAQARAQETADQPHYSTPNIQWQSAYDKALTVLAANVQVLPRYSGPVLIEGADYAGVWLECGPHEALVYRKFRPDVARNAHMTFFELQRMDGQLPCNNKVTETGFGQIQMVVPIAATAWELAQATNDEALLASAYTACSAWDNWLLRYRNTRGLRLTEGFCTYDTGHDNSPRWEGIPPQCPNKDAKNYPKGFALPRLCPDLSATTYGARLSLSHMARALGKSSEADRWTESADDTRRLILERLYVAEDAAFYDLDAKDQHVRVRSDILSRVCGEHVVDQALFDDLWKRQIHAPNAFWTNYPMPSVALDDPKFVRPLPKNSWGGPSQALTALRAPRWMDHYNRSAEFSFMMTRWCEGLMADMTFRQQMNPDTGIFTPEDLPNYSPAALVMIDYTWRLAGIVEEDDTLNWNVRPGHAAARDATFRLPTDLRTTASLIYDGTGADLKLSGKPVGRIDGVARLITDKTGKQAALVGISETPENITLHLTHHAARKLTIKPNEKIDL